MHGGLPVLVGRLDISSLPFDIRNPDGYMDD
jgi:hypothetical protein